MLELRTGDLLLMGHSCPRALPHALASGPLTPCLPPDDGTCVATEDTCILMPVIGSYTKASVKTHTFHPRSSESENLTFSHSSSGDFPDHYSLTSVTLRTVRARNSQLSKATQMDLISGAVLKCSSALRQGFLSMDVEDHPFISKNS